MQIHLCGRIWPRGLPGSCGERGLGGLSSFISQHSYSNKSIISSKALYCNRDCALVSTPGPVCICCFFVVVFYFTPGPEKALCAPVVVRGELLEGNVALKVLGAVTLRPRQTTGWLKISVLRHFHFQKISVLSHFHFHKVGYIYLGVNQVGKAG